MKIKSVKQEELVFDNGYTITSDHECDCCEHNYADFPQIDDIAMATDFDPDLEFESVDGAGFRFGNKGKMFFVPCYSEQSGYYSAEVDIYYNDEAVLHFEAEGI
jgi:hypothetical protein